MSNLENITVYFPLILSNAIQKLIDQGKYKSRSQIIRICLGEFLDKEFEFMTFMAANPEKTKKMILTVNIEKKQNKFIEYFVGDRGKGLYPSRSELIRSALRDFLLKEKHIDENIFHKENLENPDSKDYIKELILNQSGLTFTNYMLKKKGFSGTSHEMYVRLKQELIDAGKIEILKLKGGETVEIYGE